MISINATLVVQVIQFLILAFILNRIMIQPIFKLIQEREGHIENVQKEAVNIEEESERLANEYLEKEMQARREAEKERARLRQEALAEAGNFIREAEKKMLSEREKVDGSVKAEIEKVRPTLRGEAEALVGELAEKVIGRRI